MLFIRIVRAVGRGWNVILELHEGTMVTIMLMTTKTNPLNCLSFKKTSIHFKILAWRGTEKQLQDLYLQK